MMDIKLIRIRTPAAAINKEFFVQLGSRPLAIQIYGLDANARNGIVVDGFTDAGEVGLLPTDAAGWDDDAANGITIEDKGFKIGNSATIFRRNNAELLFIVFTRAGAPRGHQQTTDRNPFAKIFTLDDNLPVRDDEPFGEAKQYTADVETDGSGHYSPEFSDFGVYRES